MSKSVFSKEKLFDLLEAKVARYNTPDFIENDPICIPHQFTKMQDIEISGLFAAVLAWGQRGTIIRKCKELILMMDNDPHQFILNHRDRDLKPFLKFCHRTFNSVDTLYFISFLKWFYKDHDSLAMAFPLDSTATDTEGALVHFNKLFFSLPYSPDRTRKHISSPERKSACKRLSMYLRWMVRCDNKGVDFGLWKSISPAQLVCPFDLHVDRVSRMLKLIKRKQADWQTALELTKALRKFDPKDPVKYDFALFGMGINEGLGLTKH
jgi:uncharacterized protein (TIGR02757 family)